MLESGVSLFCGFRSSDSWPWWSGPWSGSWQPKPEKNRKRWSEEIRSDFSGSEFREMAPHEKILFIPVSQNRMSGSILARENRFIINKRKCNFWFSLVNQKLDVLVILIIQKPTGYQGWFFWNKPGYSEPQCLVLAWLIRNQTSKLFWLLQNCYSSSFEQSEKDIQFILMSYKPDIQLILVCHTPDVQFILVYH
jgi:hypothetical protein